MFIKLQPILLTFFIAFCFLQMLQLTTVIGQQNEAKLPAEPNVDYENFDNETSTETEISAPDNAEGVGIRVQSLAASSFKTRHAMCSIGGWDRHTLVFQIFYIFLIIYENEILLSPFFAF
jgi:hypothetical protein